MTNTSRITNSLPLFSLPYQTLNFYNWHLFCVLQNSKSDDKSVKFKSSSLDYENEVVTSLPVALAVRIQLRKIHESEDNFVKRFPRSLSRNKNRIPIGIKRGTLRDDRLLIFGYYYLAPDPP